MAKTISDVRIPTKSDAHVIRSDGYLIPGEVVQGNCYRVFIGKHQVAVVKTAQAAENFIRLFKLLAEVEKQPAPTMTYQLAYIEGIGF